MATMHKYLELADAAYNKRYVRGDEFGDFRLQKTEPASWIGNGFQGAVFESKEEIIVAFAGTAGNLITAPSSQTSANIRIGLGIIPNMAGAATALVEGEKAKGKPVSIVGHSLGGALAQVAGVWTGTPFVSLNGPGMADHLKIAKMNILHPKQMVRTIRSSPHDDAVGICFNTKRDFVASYGRHVGAVVSLPETFRRNHDIEAIRAGLGTSVREEPAAWNDRFRRTATNIPSRSPPGPIDASLVQPETWSRGLEQPRDNTLERPVRSLNASTTSLQPASPAPISHESKRVSRILQPSASQPQLRSTTMRAGVDRPLPPVPGASTSEPTSSQVRSDDPVASRQEPVRSTAAPAVILGSRTAATMTRRALPVPGESSRRLPIDEPGPFLSNLGSSFRPETSSGMLEPRADISTSQAVRPHDASATSQEIAFREPRPGEVGSAPGRLRPSASQSRLGPVIREAGAVRPLPSKPRATTTNANSPRIQSEGAGASLQDAIRPEVVPTPTLGGQTAAIMPRRALPVPGHAARAPINGPDRPVYGRMQGSSLRPETSNPVPQHHGDSSVGPSFLRIDPRAMDAERDPRGLPSEENGGTSRILRPSASSPQLRPAIVAGQAIRRLPRTPEASTLDAHASGVRGDDAGTSRQEAAGSKVAPLTTGGGQTTATATRRALLVPAVEVANLPTIASAHVPSSSSVHPNQGRALPTPRVYPGIPMPQVPTVLEAVRNRPTADLDSERRRFAAARADRRHDEGEASADRDNDPRARERSRGGGQ